MPTLQTMELQALERSGSNHQPGWIDSSSSPRPDEAAEDEIGALQAPSADRGRPAFLALVGCVLVQAPIVAGPPSAIASIGASQTGIMYLMMPLSFAALIKYHRLRRWCGPMGLVMTTASLVVSAYATTVGQLVATQGVLYATGCGLLFSPTSLYLDEWFVERKGMAYGVMWAGKSTVAVTLVSAILTIPLLVLLKPRIPLSANARTAQRPLSFAFSKSTYFWMLQTGSMLQSMGYLMPQTYIASYAQSLGLPDITGPTLLALFQGASVPGSLIFGPLGDRFPVTTVILVSSVGSALAVFLLWGISQKFAVLAVFCLTYGFFAGGFSSTWSDILQEVKRQDTSLDTGLIFGMLMGGRGVGFVLSGPLSRALLNTSRLSTASLSGYATRYGPMIICTGLTATLGAWVSFWDFGKRTTRSVP
ncbi:uncharacterized protein PG986_003416 [Apiospora aurea]|uniref:Major facilitator superfamily (MFS) profile domain-containing protein n=1 Tax=Apiospora aurea TaxID=335848 RepID=A0ABR1QT81_9PEZI